MQNKDLHYMQRALDLAQKGSGKVSPNPMVGCVIVCDDEIIGEGYHEQYGGLHAEPNAVNSVVDKAKIKQSTVYVTLEPCAHFGKTPPCADLLLSHSPKRVVICNDDPNPLVAGKGIEALRNAGIEVESGVLNEKGRSLNKRFFTFQEKKRPYVILKWAQTKDGFIARNNFDSKWISGEASRRLVHQWRSEESAIMVGTNTALHDNPQLNVRMVEGNNPVRVVLDKGLRLPINLHLFDNTQKTIVYNSSKNEEKDALSYIQLDFSTTVIEQVLTDLHKRGISSIIIEGGTTLLNAFLEEGLWDEAKVFKSTVVAFEEGILAPKSPRNRIFSQQIEADRLEYYMNS